MFQHYFNFNHPYALVLLQESEKVQFLFEINVIASCYKSLFKCFFLWYLSSTSSWNGTMSESSDFFLSRSEL